MLELGRVDSNERTETSWVHSEVYKCVCLLLSSTIGRIPNYLSPAQYIPGGGHAAALSFSVMQQRAVALRGPPCAAQRHQRVPSFHVGVTL